MQIDNRIILAGRAPDVAGSVARGASAGNALYEMDRQRQLHALYQSQGAGIAAGDQGALNALAAYDPMASQAAQSGALGVTGARLDNQYRQKQLDVLSAEEARAVEEHAARMSEAERAQTAAQVEEAIKYGLALPDAEAWDKAMTEFGMPDMVGRFGDRFAMANRYITIADIIAGPPDKRTTDEKNYDRAKVDPEFDAWTRKNKEAGATKVTVNTAAEGENLGVGDVYNPGTVDQAVELIDNIVSSPALDRITGPIEGGGGNDIGQMSSMRRAWYGEDGLDAIDRLNQLESQAWLAVREILKGGGAITDYESNKAVAAAIRASRAKGKEALIAALTELREAIVDGRRKVMEAQAAKKAAGTQAPGKPAQQGAPQPGAVEDGYIFKGGDPADPKNWEVAR